MKFETEEQGAHTVLRMHGAISVGEVTQALAKTLGTLEQEKAGAVIVDLTELKSLDSTALGLLVGSLRRLHALNREMMLVHPNERVALLLSMTQLDTVFPVHRTLAEAFDALERKTGGVTDRDVRRPDSV